MSGHIVAGLVSRCKVFIVLALVDVSIGSGLGLVPRTDIFGHIGVYIALVVNKIQTLVHIDDDVEEGLDPLARLEYCGHHGHAEEFGEFSAVEGIATALELVVHIEGADHAEVHVDELGGKIEVALYVAGIYDVDNHIGHLLNNLFADVDLFWAIGS